MGGGDLPSSEIAVGVGLHVLRYVSSSAESLAPSVEVTVDRSCVGFVDLIGDPRARSGVLAVAGSALIVRCSGEGGRIRLRIVPRMAGASMDARVQLEPVARGNVFVAPAPVPRQARVEQPVSALKVLGHVSRRGDVVVGSGEWIAGPAGPLPIEGFEVRGVSPDLGLEYQVLSGGRAKQWSPWVSAGQFAGSRGQSRPLLGVRMRLWKGDAGTLKVQALFLGAPIVSRSGRSIEVVGSSVGDPLVGLSFALDGEVSRPVERQEMAPVSPVPSSNSVRVFRAGGF